MAKLLIKKEKKEFIPELKREITVSKGEFYYVKDISKDFHAKSGIISKKDLEKKDGSKILSSTKKEFTILTPTFIDNYKAMTRLPQMPLLKDIGLIIAETGINKSSKVVDCGGGSGGVACTLANICKEVTTYEIRKEHAEVIKKNKTLLNLKNLKIKNQDVYKGIKEKNVDVITVDLPSPWNVIETAEKALKPGGFLVVYTPNILQQADFVNTLKQNEHFLFLKTVELINREWKIENRIVRPKSHSSVHSGFITFARNLTP